MARRIITDADVKDGKAVQKDSYSGKLLKYIPADVIAVFLTLDHTMTAWLKNNPADTDFVHHAEWIVFGILLITTPFYLYKTGVLSRTQLTIATGSFALWVFSLGGPFTFVNHRDLISALALPLFTFLIPLI